MTKVIDSEKVVERKLTEAIKNLGGLSIKLLSDYIIGLPDRLCLLPNQKVIFVELKTTGQKPRKIQIYMHNKLRQLGFRVEVIDSLSRLNEFIQSLEC